MSPATPRVPADPDQTVAPGDITGEPVNTAVSLAATRGSMPTSGRRKTPVRALVGRVDDEGSYSVVRVDLSVDDIQGPSALDQSVTLTDGTPAFFFEAEEGGVLRFQRGHFWVYLTGQLPANELVEGASALTVNDDGTVAFAITGVGATKWRVLA